MPELPEVETVARQLAPMLEGQTVETVKILDKKIAGNFRGLKKCRIQSTERLGKQVLLTLCLKETVWYLAIHLRMTGRLIWFSKGIENGQEAIFYYQQRDPDEKYVRVKLLCDGGELRFYDTRRFGTFVASQSRADFEPQGIDPTSSAFTLPALQSLMSTSKQPLKAWLLRQDKIVGLGNIYVCEIMFAAKLNPSTPVNALDRNAVARVHRHTQRILAQAIDNCGTTFSDFQTAEGEIGEYQQFLKVYGREGEPCPRCKAIILRQVQGGRSTFFCPKCQQ